MAQMSAISRQPPGALDWTFYRSDTDPRDLWMIAMFESKDAYQRNAESPAQHAVYLLLRACLEDDPEWHDVGELATFIPKQREGHSARGSGAPGMPPRTR